MTEAAVPERLRPLIERLLAADEQVLAVVDAVEDVGVLRRVAFGSAWWSCHRVLLVLTQCRLIEVALDVVGVAPLGNGVVRPHYRNPPCSEVGFAVLRRGSPTLTKQSWRYGSSRAR